MDGILCVYKESGYTSHDVINRLRRISGQKRIGHTGTLDPNAEGVLPVCFGNATKVCSILTDTDKTYQAELILGITTDSYDITGNVLTRTEARITKDRLNEEIKTFLGIQYQVPPMFSARKVNGQKLYDLARQGITIERKPKEINLYDISLDGVQLQEGTEFVSSAMITVRCSKGTYIRSICHDLGEKLGPGACMGSLLRTKVGRFSLNESFKLQELITLAERGELENTLIPADAMFLEYPALQHLSDEANSLLQNGNKIPIKQIESSDLREDFQGRYRMYNQEGRFCAIYEYQQEKKELIPLTMFPEYCP